MSAPFAPPPSAAVLVPTTPAPQKFLQVNGVMKMNPEYKKWKEKCNGQEDANSTVYYSPTEALPVVNHLKDHKALNEICVAPLAESTRATLEILQEPEIYVHGSAGPTPEGALDSLAVIFAKYDIPLGLMNKLMMLAEYDSLQFIVDDSGSMTVDSDTVDAQGQPQTRWQEAQTRLKEMMEMLAHIPLVNKVEICFLNRSDRIVMERNHRDPHTLFHILCGQIDHVFHAKQPSGGTPALERLHESFAMGTGQSIARYFFGDGMPDGGAIAKQQMAELLCYRPDPERNPVTFISCTNKDEEVEWMKELEEVAPNCSESDDFSDEAREVYRDQGAALPYTRGFHLVAQLVAAMNPDDLDAMDESIPFTKQTLDNLLGIQHNIETYRHYFDYFLQAKRERTVQNPTDALKKRVDWEASYHEFLTVPVASQIPAVQNFQSELKVLELVDRQESQ